jgi:hypothetical protein
MHENCTKKEMNKKKGGSIGDIKSIQSEEIYVDGAVTWIRFKKIGCDILTSSQKRKKIQRDREKERKERIAFLAVL